MPSITEYGTEYELEVCAAIDNNASLVRIDRVQAFRYVQTVNDIGSFLITLPADLGSWWFDRDRLINIYRKPANSARYRDFRGLCGILELATDQNGALNNQVAGPDLNELLNRRIIAYTSDSAQAQKTAAADDMLKEIVTENLGSSAGTNRAWPSTTLTVQANASAAPSITMGFSNRNVLETLKSISEASRNLGTDIYFGIVSTSDTSYEFQTKITQWGSDRTVATGRNPLIFGLEYGNLENPRYSQDWTTYKNFIYAGGQGLGSARISATANDNEGTIYQRRAEYFYNASQSSAASSVQSDAYAQLIKYRTQRIFTANVISVPGAAYGIDWFLGDKVTCTYRGHQFTAMIRTVQIEVTETGSEKIMAGVESYG